MNRRDTKGQITIYGQRHFERLVDLCVKSPDDAFHAKIMADSLAALVSEVTPLHREVLASQYLTQGAKGRTRTHPLPPGLPENDILAQRRWAALVFLDCVDHAGDLLAAEHDLPERLGWRAAAERYSGGAERYGRAYDA